MLKRKFTIFIMIVVFIIAAFFILNFAYEKARDFLLEKAISQAMPELETLDLSSVSDELSQITETIETKEPDIESTSDDTSDDKANNDESKKDSNKTTVDSKNKTTPNNSNSANDILSRMTKEDKDRIYAIVSGVISLDQVPRLMSLYASKTPEAKAELKAVYNKFTPDQRSEMLFIYSKYAKK